MRLKTFWCHLLMNSWILNFLAKLEVGLNFYIYSYFFLFSAEKELFNNHHQEGSIYGTWLPCFRRPWGKYYIYDIKSKSLHFYRVSFRQFCGISFSCFLCHILKDLKDIKWRGKLAFKVQDFTIFQKLTIHILSSF